MYIETYRSYCLQKQSVKESFPFDQKTLVFKVAGKIFTLASIEPFESINVKCDPNKAIQLREKYASVLPGYHMNKQHWNTIILNKELSDSQVFKLIDHSYQLILEALPKRILHSSLFQPPKK